MRQYRLKSGNTYLISWLDKDVKVGDTITLKDSDEPNRLWEVLTKGNHEHLKEEVRNSYHKNKLPSIRKV